MDEPTSVSILILGDSGCGKSTFLSRLSVGQQDQNRDKKHDQRLSQHGASLPTLRDMDQPFIYGVRLYNRRYKFEFHDTSSYQRHWTLLKPDLVILAFDISSRESLGSLKGWRDDTTRYFQSSSLNPTTDGERIPIMVLGLKRDLRVEGEGTIYPQEACRIAQELRCDLYAECSALTGELIPEVFEDIARTAAKSTTEAGGQTIGGCTML